MRFVFLGTGTSSGIPAIACDCAVCTSADPRDRRLRSGAALSFVDPLGQARTILIDATPDLRQQALANNLRRCDAILFTHHHVDHIFGLDEVRRFNVVQRSPVDVFADATTTDALRRVYAHVFERERNVNDSFVAHLIAHQLRPLEAFELFRLRVTPLPLLHGKLPILGFRIERGPGFARGAAPEEHDPLPLAYCTDVSSVPPQTWGALRGLRTLVLDALRHRHHPTHLTIDRAVEIAGEVGARRTYFTHIAHEVSHAQTSEQLPESMALAFDGLTLGEPG
jgi:phosphoribosyl 1,2-cyclic phosphate phosphodiesterase